MELIDETSVAAQYYPTLYFVLQDGTYAGAFATDSSYWPAGGVEVASAPEAADQIWSFDTQTWGPSRMIAVQREQDWAASEIPAIARQLEALEEDEAGETPEDLLPGARNQWLGYRGKVRCWKDGASGFPEIEQRPVRPT